MLDSTAELPPSCERFRAITSLRLDAELSPLEAVLHTVHADRCEDCAAYAAELAAITARIRTTPTERRPRLLPSPPRRRPHVARHALAAGALVVMIAAGLTGARGVPAAAEAPVSQGSGSTAKAI